MLDYVKVASDLIQGIAWPVAVVIAVILFRKPLVGFVSKLGSALDNADEVSGPGGIKYKARQQQVPEPQNSLVTDGADKKAISAVSQAEGNSLVPLTRASLLAERFDPLEAELGAWLKRLRDEITTDTYPESNLGRRLLLGLALALRREWFAQLLRVIYGSQLELMAVMRAFGRAGQPEIERHHNEHNTRAGGAGESLDKWLEFLTEYELASVDGDGIATLSIHGQRLLEYIEAQGLQPSDFVW